MLRGSQGAGVCLPTPIPAPTGPLHPFAEHPSAAHLGRCPPTQDDAVGCCRRLPDEPHQGGPHFRKEEPHGGPGHCRERDGGHWGVGKSARSHPLGMGTLHVLVRGREISSEDRDRMGLGTQGTPQPTQVLSPTVIQRPLEDRRPAGDTIADPGEGQHPDLVQGVLGQPGELGAAGGIALRQPELGTRLRALLLVQHLQHSPCDTAGPGWH